MTDDNLPIPSIVGEKVKCRLCGKTGHARLRGRPTCNKCAKKEYEEQYGPIAKKPDNEPDDSQASLF